MTTTEEMLAGISIYLDCDNITRTVITPTTYDQSGMLDEYGIIRFETTFWRLECVPMVFTSNNVPTILITPYLAVQDIRLEVIHNPTPMNNESYLVRWVYMQNDVVIHHAQTDTVDNAILETWLYLVEMGYTGYAGELK